MSRNKAERETVTSETPEGQGCHQVNQREKGLIKGDVGVLILVLVIVGANEKRKSISLNNS